MPAGARPPRIRAGEFEAPWWLRSGHLQTLWSTLVRRGPRPALRRERLELDDGDFIDLDWHGEAAASPLVVLLHGLEGSSASPYAWGMAAALSDRGWRAVIAHFRGCSGERNRLDRGYHSGDTADLEHILVTLAAREPDTPVGAVGFSLGGNVLLKWLGEQPGEERLLTAAAAVSVPFELGGVADRLERGFSRLYRWHLLRSMRSRTLAKFADRAEPPIDLTAAASAHGFREFDDAVTAPLHGFAGVDDYYGRSSSRQFLGGIAVPTLIVHAEDDPFSSRSIIPDHAELGPGVTLELSRGGGHVGFIAGASPWRARYWLEERIPRHLERFLDARAGRSRRAGRGGS